MIQVPAPVASQEELEVPEAVDHPCLPESWKCQAPEASYQTHLVAVPEDDMEEPVEHHWEDPVEAHQEVPMVVHSVVVLVAEHHPCHQQWWMVATSLHHFRHLLLLEMGIQIHLQFWRCHPDWETSVSHRLLHGHI